MNEQTRKQLLKTVRDNYSAIAGDFSRSRNRPLWPELVSIINGLDLKHKSVLDVGCGNGRLAELLPADSTYTGVDNCAELITIAKQQASEHQTNSTFMVADILDLNSLSQLNFDYVFAIAVLHHLPSYKLRLEALKQLKNKLAPNGKLIITNWNLWGNPKYFKLIIKFWLLKLYKKHQMDFGDILFDWENTASAGSQRYYHALTFKELKQLAKEADLHVEANYKDKLNYYLIAKK